MQSARRADRSCGRGEGGEPGSRLVGIGPAVGKSTIAAALTEGDPVGIVRDCGDFELTASSSYSLRWKAPPKDEAEREARAALAAKLQGGSIEINRLREQQESSLLDLVMRTVDANEADVEERIKRRERRRAELREREEKGRARKQAIRDGRRVAADRG